MALSRNDLTDSQLNALQIMARGGISLALDKRDVDHLIQLGLAAKKLGGPGITEAGKKLLRSP